MQKFVMLALGLSYFVGEKGQEVFTPGAAGGISTNAALDRLSAMGSASCANLVAESGRQVVDGTGDPVAPTPEAIRKARPEPAARSEKGGRRGNFHGGVHHWHIQGGDPQEIRGKSRASSANFFASMKMTNVGACRIDRHRFREDPPVDRLAFLVGERRPEVVKPRRRANTGCARVG